MCTVVVLRRPGHPWPVLIAANRDEMADRPWRPPARHWPDRPDVVAGLDVPGGGTWLGINDDGVVAAVLNRMGTLGPLAGKRSRGELPLEALDHGDAADAAEALSQLAAEAYRPFNLVLADNRDAFWLRNLGGAVEVFPLPPGLSMITARDRNDMTAPRIAAFLPRFANAAAPNPEAGDWRDWEALLATPPLPGPADPEVGLCLTHPDGFGTVCGTLIALPAMERAGVRPLCRFAAGKPGQVPYEPVTL